MALRASRGGIRPAYPVSLGENENGLPAPGIRYYSHLALGRPPSFTASRKEIRGDPGWRLCLVEHFLLIYAMLGSETLTGGPSRMVVRVTELTDARLLQLFREVFEITYDDVTRTGVSRSTWVRIERGEEREHTAGVERRLQQIRALMAIVGQMPYLEAKEWAIRPLRGLGGKAPRHLVLSQTGLGYLLSRLRSRGELVAT